MPAPGSAWPSRAASSKAWAASITVDQRAGPRLASSRFVLPSVTAPDAGQARSIDAGVAGQTALIVSRSPFEAPFLRGTA